MMIYGTMDTTYHGLGGKEQEATMSQPTQPKDLGQVVHN
jgi:hypothetical protein